MFLKILRALEGLAAKVTLMRLERDVDADVGGDVIALHGCGAACSPLAGQVEVVGALAADMAFANVVLWEISAVHCDVCACRRIATHIECFGIVATLSAALPLASEVVDGRGGCRLRYLNRRRRGGLGCLLRRSLHGLCDCLDTFHLRRS